MVAFEIVSVVASGVASEVGAVVELDMGIVGAPVAVPPLAPEAATKAVTSPDIVDLHTLIVVGNFLLSSRRSYNNLFCSVIREVLTNKAGF